jgi:hypothetical protein
MSFKRAKELDIERLEDCSEIRWKEEESQSYLPISSNHLDRGVNFCSIKDEEAKIPACP